MTDSLLHGLPFTPASRPVAGATLAHMKDALDVLVAPGAIRADDDSPMSLTASRLVAGGVLIHATLPAGTEVHHDQSHVSRLAADEVLASFVIQGEGVAAQAGRTLHFQAGDVFFRKSRLPSTVRIEQASRMLLLRCAYGRFNGGHRGRNAEFVPALSRHDSALRRMLWAFVEQVLPSLAESSVNTVSHAEHALVSLLSAVYEESRQAVAERPEPGKARAELRWDILVSTLTTLMCEPDLTVGQLAGTLGISTRLVHSLFEANGLRYSSYLLERRLEKAMADLLSPQFGALSIAEIAYRAGFNSPSHFGRCFRQRYGATPAQCRLAGGALAAP